MLALNQASAHPVHRALVVVVGLWGLWGTPATGADGAPVSPSSSLQIAVQQGGDVSWKGACSGVAYDMDADPDAIADRTDDVSKPWPLPSGRYEVVVSCPSTEGAVVATVKAAVGPKPSKASLSLSPGFLYVRVFRDEVERTAEVVLYDDAGREVGRGRDRGIFPVQKGPVKVTARISAKDAGATQPVVGTATATITTRQKSTVTVDATDGTVVCTVLDNGKSAKGQCALRLPGQRARLMEFAAGAPQPAPPGRYDVVTQLEDSHDSAEVVVRGVVIKPEQRTDVSGRHSRGSLAPRVVQGGKAVKSGVTLEVKRRGAPQAFATVAAGETLRVAPGKYTVTATGDVTLDDGSKTSASVDATVSAGQTAAPTLSLSSSELVVRTSVGGKPRALEVRVRVPGAEEPVAQKRSGEGAPASFSLPPGRYVVDARFAAGVGAGESEASARKPVTLTAGGSARVDIDLEVGTVIVQVFEDGVAVAAEVQLAAESGAKGDTPILVRAGEESVVPPGAYRLDVVRRGKKTSHGTLKVGPGRTVERQVELMAP